MTKGYLQFQHVFVPEPTARSAVPGVSPGRRLLILLSAKFKVVVDGRRALGMSWRHALTDLNNMADYHDW